MARITHIFVLPFPSPCTVLRWKWTHRAAWRFTSGSRQLEEAPLPPTPFLSESSHSPGDQWHICCFGYWRGSSHPTVCWVAVARFEVRSLSPLRLIVFFPAVADHLAFDYLYRGTTNVGEKSLKAIIDGKHDSSLTSLNLSSTSVKPLNLVDVLARCLGLEELKLANLQSFVSRLSLCPSWCSADEIFLQNDNALGHLLDAVLIASRDANATSSPLQNLKKLKLRGAVSLPCITGLARNFMREKLTLRLTSTCRSRKSPRPPSTDFSPSHLPSHPSTSPLPP